MKTTYVDAKNLIDVNYLKEEIRFQRSELDFGTLDNVKNGIGHYKIFGQIFMSIWKYKNIYGGINTTEQNYEDACEMVGNGLISEKIIVYTGSSYFPKVNGYLKNELDIYFN